MKSKNSWFENKVALITGASSGIGKALALNLSNNKPFLVLAARNETELKIVVRECEKNGAHALAILTDVANQEGCRQLVEPKS